MVFTAKKGIEGKKEGLFNPLNCHFLAKGTNLGPKRPFQDKKCHVRPKKVIKAKKGHFTSKIGPKVDQLILLCDYTNFI